MIYKAIMIILITIGFFTHSCSHRDNIKDNTQTSLLKAIDDTLWMITYFIMFMCFALFL